MRNKLAGFFGKLACFAYDFRTIGGHSSSIMLVKTTTACSDFHACHFASSFPVADTRNEQADGFFHTAPARQIVQPRLRNGLQK
jgi:hypothetical protein